MIVNLSIISGNISLTDKLFHSKKIYTINKESEKKNRMSQLNILFYIRI